MIDYLSRLVSGVACRVAALEHVTQRELDNRLTELEERLMTAFERESAVQNRVLAYFATMLAEVQSLHQSIVTKDAALAAAQDALASEVAGRDAEITRQVGAALELDAQRDAERLEALLRQAEGEVPGETPVVEVPGPGEPAEPPPDSGVTPIDEGTLPDTEVPTPGA